MLSTYGVEHLTGPNVWVVGGVMVHRRNKPGPTNFFLCVVQYVWPLKRKYIIEDQDLMHDVLIFLLMFHQELISAV